MRKMMKLNLLSIFLLTFIFTTSFATSSLAEENDVNKYKINNSEFNNELIVSPPGDGEVGILSKGVNITKARLDWGGLRGSSAFDKKKGDVSYYLNPRNRSAARKELDRIGGKGEIIITPSKNGTTYLKRTDGGKSITLYTSSSKTNGAQRPTLSFENDKIRFMGD